MTYWFDPMFPAEGKLLKINVTVLKRKEKLVILERKLIDARIVPESTLGGRILQGQGYHRFAKACNIQTEMSGNPSAGKGQRCTPVHWSRL